MCPVVLTRGSDQMPVSTKFDMRGDDNVMRNYGRMLVRFPAGASTGCNASFRLFFSFFFHRIDGVDKMTSGR
jgi:hypothetical protein